MHYYKFSDLFIIIEYNFYRTGVIIRDSNATIIGKGMFMNKGTEDTYEYSLWSYYILHAENEMYGQVVLQENMSKKKDEINLPKAVGKKVIFQQLKVRNLIISENNVQYYTRDL